MSRTESTKPVMSRRAFIGGLAMGMAAASPALAAAPAILKGAGDYRALNLINGHTDERLNCLYWLEGEYVPEALEAVNYIMRDWRVDAVMPIDRRTLDIMAATHGLLRTGEPLHIVSGYRSPTTNAMLRSRSRNVAQKSYHLKGMAVDLSIKNRTVWEISQAAKKLGAGGVGMYSRSNFTHLDSGPVRDWGS